MRSKYQSWPAETWLPVELVKVSGPRQYREYRHRNGVDAISVPVGSEPDRTFAGEPDWEPVDETSANDEENPQP
jgi:hypothetical protein